MPFRPNIDKFRFMFSYFEQCCMWAIMIANGSVMKVKRNKRAFMSLFTLSANSYTLLDISKGFYSNLLATVY